MFALSPGKVLLVACLLGALLLTTQALLGVPPPTGVAVLSLAIFLAVLLLGALSPRLEMYGPVFWRGPSAGRMVALTFDDGPAPESTSRVLDLLAERGMQATFFVIGRRAQDHPELIQRMVSEGHAVGVHGMDHHRGYAFLSPARVADDLESCARAVMAAGAPRPLWFRPPIGQASSRTFAGARRARMEVVGWSLRARDGWRRTKREAVLSRLEKALGPGSIVLLHDAWERPAGAHEEPPLGALLLPEILDLCVQRRLTPVTLDLLVQGDAAGRSTTKRAPEA